MTLEAHKEYDSFPDDVVGFSTRTKNLLKEHGIYSRIEVSDLVEKFRSGGGVAKGFGGRSINEMRCYLQDTKPKTMNDKLQTINELAPIASRLRDREEQISALKRDMIGNLSELIGLAGEQGKDLIIAKTKLSGKMSFSDFLSCHTPTITEVQAKKYERITTEHVTGFRQAMFAFLDVDVDDTDKPKRLPPAQWESAIGLINRLSRVNVIEWPEDRVCEARKSMADVVERLGGKVEWKA